jgi:hypothetical protein
MSMVQSAVKQLRQFDISCGVDNLSLGGGEVVASALAVTYDWPTSMWQVNG